MTYITAAVPTKEKKQLEKYLEGKLVYDESINLLKNNISDIIYYNWIFSW